MEMRYIGCKSKLLQVIEKLIQDKNLYDGCYTFFDAFSGTGCVGWNIVLTMSCGAALKLAFLLDKVTVCSSFGEFLAKPH